MTLSSDEKAYPLPDDWNDLGCDEELAMLAVNELSQLSEVDELEDITNVPLPALNAVFDMSLDAALF